MNNSLREGFTTGTAAAAAAMAALETLLSGEAPAFVDVPLPPFGEEEGIPGEGKGPFPPPSSLTIPVESVMVSTRTARAVVQKDGGDDPDATRHARIVAVVELCGMQEAAAPLGVALEGGAGVGRATLPGLPVAVGEAAINPVPRMQIARGVRLTATLLGYHGGVRVRVEVPEGEALARKTLNPRLGIVGGISILGTQGTVKPFSHEAWQATILQGMEVAAATGCTTLCLSTGRRSERLLGNLYPDLPAQAFVQAADFVRFSLEEAGRRPFKTLVWGCFFGKLCKLAQGCANTHAHNAELDLAALARHCAEHGCAAPVENCNTAGQALELLLADPAGGVVLEAVARRAASTARAFAGKPVNIHLFHLNGAELLRI